MRCSRSRRRKASGAASLPPIPRSKATTSCCSSGCTSREGSVWDPPSRPRIAKAVRSILERQLPDGGFNIYAGGPAEINATIKAYTALKLAGLAPDGEPLRRARKRILALGGLQAANSYVKINLSLFGLYPRKHVPSVPPEIVMLPGNVLYEMSSWTRSIIVPLSIVQSRGSNRRAPAGFTLDELLVPRVSLRLPKRSGLSVLFHHLDRVFKVWEKRGSERIRTAAIREAERWVLARTQHTEGLGAIYPAMMYMIMALDALDYACDHPDRVEAIRHFESLLLETEDGFMFQPCVSPIWDTALAAFALGEAGITDDPRMTRAADWLISKEVRRRGDWSVKRPDTEPSGWAFEFANEFYPDIDDTAMVLLALMHAKASNPAGAGGLRTPRHQLAAGHAIGRRRLGRVRRRQQLGGAQPGPVCRPQRHAGSDLPGHHRPRGRVPFAPRHAGTRRGEARRGLPAGRAGEGRQLVRPLGRELYLRQFPRHARTGRQRGARGARGDSPRGALAALHPELRRRLGRELRAATSATAM